MFQKILERLIFLDRNKEKKHKKHKRRKQEDEEKLKKKEEFEKDANAHGGWWLTSKIDDFKGKCRERPIDAKLFNGS